MHFDDMKVGFRYETGTATVTRDEIVGFAREWDPQPFHLDEEAAKASPYGRLIASGWHTLMIGFRLTLAADIWAEASMGSPGMQDVRWIRPVHPGDTLQVRAEVVKATPSRSKPDRGFVDIANEVVNQEGVVVASYTGTHMLRRRG